MSQTFFYKVPSLFSLRSVGNGSGTFTSAASVPGETLPTNGALLNIGKGYTITAKPRPFSTFSKWTNGSGVISSQPTLSFTMQAGFALTAVFEEIPPAVSISSPAANLRTAVAPAFNGTASGHFPITNVVCSFANANGSATLTSGSGSVSNWSFSLVPAPGSNVLAVYCVDINGVESAVLYREFFYEVPSRLAVINVGSGNGFFNGATPVIGGPVPADGAMLNLGENYAITAIPGPSSLFSNWVTSAGGSSSRPTLSFTMQSNLVLTATFITNFFPAVAGTYNGLFFPGNGVSKETSGMLYNLALQENGRFHGQVFDVRDKLLRRRPIRRFRSSRLCCRPIAGFPGLGHCHSADYRDCFWLRIQRQSHCRIGWRLPAFLRLHSSSFAVRQYFGQFAARRWLHSGH